MCEVRIYLYRVLYALAMDWSLFEFRDSCRYGIVWYGMVSSVLLYYVKYIVFCILSILGSFQIIHEVIEIMFKV